MAFITRVSTVAVLLALTARPCAAQTDLAAGTLVAATSDWTHSYRTAAQLSLAHTPSIGCRSLDILHCALAAELQATEFISTDSRQCRLARTMGLCWSPL